MSVSKHAIARRLKRVLMKVGREDVPIIDNRVSYNPGLQGYFDGRDSMNKFVVVGDNGTLPDPIELGTMVLVKHTVTPKVSTSIKGQAPTYHVENDKIVITGNQPDTSGQDLVDGNPITYYEVGYNEDGNVKWMEVNDEQMEKLLKIKSSKRNSWPTNNLVTTTDHRVEKARTIIGAIGKRSDDPSTIDHNMTTGQRRRLLGRIGINNLGMGLYCSTALAGGHCGECRQWTRAMLEMMPKNLYDSICNGKVPYACCSDKDLGGIDHCYVTFAEDSTTPDDWIKKGSKIRVFDLWYRKGFKELSENLHYKKDTYDKNNTLKDQMGYDKIENDETNGMKKWLRGVPFEHLSRAKASIYETQAEIYFKSMHVLGPDAVRESDEKMLQLLEKVEKDARHNLGIQDPPRITIEEMAKLDAWILDVNTRETKDVNLKGAVKRWEGLRDSIDSYWEFIKSNLNDPNLEGSRKNEIMDQVTQSMQGDLYVDGVVQDQWTLSYFEEQIKKCTKANDCLNIVDRLSVFYALMDCSYMDNKEIEKQLDHCKQLYQACLDRGKDFPKQKHWQERVDRHFDSLTQVMEEMIQSWNKDRENTKQVSTDFKIK